MTMVDAGYAIELVRHHDQRISTWSGGTTTEIAIYPPDAVYRRRDFLWRISSARVDTETSTFTSLPGYRRLLMVLEGDMTLRHEGHHCARLTPFQQDAFSGAWTTSSGGRARDFNVMLAQGCDGRLRADQLAPGSSQVISPDCPGADDDTRRGVRVIYAVDGAVAVTIGREPWVSLGAGDALLITVDRGRLLPRVVAQNGTSHGVHIVTTAIRYVDPADAATGYTTRGA